MGLFGHELGKIGGGIIGGIAGGLIGGKKGKKIGSKLGADIGGTAGLAYPAFKKGGKVKKTGLALVHKNEFVLPAGVEPTKAQKDAVAKRHRGKGGKHSLIDKPVGVLFA